MRAKAIGAVCGFAAVAALIAAPSALGFGLENLSVTTSPQAGSNSDVTISLEVSEPEQDLRDLTIHLPPGLVGNPLAAPQCTEQQLLADDCPDLSQVGTTTSGVDAFLAILPLVPIPLTVQGSIYNLAPQPGEPARFGIVLRPIGSDPLPLLPKIFLQSPAALRESDFGLDTVLEGLPRDTAGGAVLLDVTSLSLTLDGEVNDPPQGFIRLPTSCKEHAVGFDAVAYDESTASGQASFTTSGCESLPFSPELTARARPHGIGQPVELSTTISQTPDEAGLANAQVILPNGITGNNALLGIKCPLTDFEAGTCPPNTLIGSASATSPLQAQALTGTVNLIEPAVPGLPDIGLDLRGPLALKLTGSLTLGPDGRAITTFAGLPDIPIADFDLAFARDPGFVFAGRDLCTSPPVSVEGAFRSFSGAETSVQAPLVLDGCGPAKAKRPRASVKLKRADSNRPKLVFKAKAGDDALRRAKLKLPRKLALARAKKLKRASAIEADGDRLAPGKVRRRKRSLTLKAGGAETVRAKLAKGAVRKHGKLGGRPKFRVALTDTQGKTTRLVVRAK
jgi:hypothetical protein